LIKGPYPLGKVDYADKELYPFGLRDRDWVRHVCISGMSGSGKTNFAYQVLGNFNTHIFEVLNFNISIIFFCCAISIYFLTLFKVDKTGIDLENPSFKASNEGTVRIGRVMRGSTKKYNFFLSDKDLEKHMFICGSTGTGKSNFIQNFLISEINNQLAGAYGGYEIPKKFLFIAQDFTLENGFLTQTMKLKRRI